MAAPGSAYSPKIWYKYDTTKDNNQGLLIRLPRALKEYALAGAGKTEWAQLTDYEKTTGADIWFKNTFACDLVKHYNFIYSYPDPESQTTPPATINEPMYCVVGWLKETPSSSSLTEMQNAKLHNQTGTDTSSPKNRKGKPRIKVGGVNYFLLNDGGLNTRPWAEFSYTNVIPGTEDNPHYWPIVKVTPYRVVFTINFWNAYYLNTDNLRVRVEVMSSASSSATIISYKDFIIADLPKQAKLREYESSPYKVTIMNPNMDGNFIEDAYYRIKLFITNAEGTYESDYTDIYQVDPEPQLWRIYKITSLSEDPMAPATGIPYDVVLIGGIYDKTPTTTPTYTQTGYYREAVSHDTAPTTPGFQEFDWPTFYNLIGGDAIAANPPSSATQTLSFVVNGAAANTSDDPLTSILPEGMYSRFPVVWPYESITDPTQAVPENEWRYVPGTSTTPIVYIDSNGRPYKWTASTYSPPPGPTPGTTPEVESVYCQIITTGASSYCSSYILDSTSGEAVIHLRPYVVLYGAKGNISVPIRVEYGYYDSQQEQEEGVIPQDLTTAITAVPNAGNTVVATYEVRVADPGSPATTSEFPDIEIRIPFGPNGMSQQYYVKYKVLAGQAISGIQEHEPAVTPTPSDWPATNPPDIWAEVDDSGDTVWIVNK